MFAVVDIETTGLWHQDHAITEISVVHVDGDSVKEVFHSLVKPLRRIPAGVSQLTGISDSLLANAPLITDILESLHTALEGRIFVGHHVNFDYQFVKAAFEASGIVFAPRRLCTLRLARNVLPGLHSYKLGSLCSKLNIQAHAPLHRAGSDALATAHLFLALRKLDTEQHTENAIKQRSRSSILPANISERQIDELPESPGVYYLKRQDGKVIYVGKARNIKSRVLSHFTASGSASNRQLFQRLVYSVSYRSTQSEYMALLLEDAEIKLNYPPLNRAQKNPAGRFAVVAYTDRLNRNLLAVVPSIRQAGAIARFTSYHAARTWIQDRLDAHGLAQLKPGMLHLQHDNALPAQELHARFEALLREAKAECEQSYVLAESIVDGTYDFALVINGIYVGFGTTNSLNPTHPEYYLNIIHKAPDSATARCIINRMENDQNILKMNLHDEC
jgi:DNA polymerase-3 subunit epsilon